MACDGGGCFEFNALAVERFSVGAFSGELSGVDASDGAL